MDCHTAAAVLVVQAGGRCRTVDLFVQYAMMLIEKRAALGVMFYVKHRLSARRVVIARTSVDSTMCADHHILVTTLAIKPFEYCIDDQASGLVC